MLCISCSALNQCTMLRVHGCCLRVQTLCLVFEAGSRCKLIHCPCIGLCCACAVLCHHVAAQRCAVLCFALCCAMLCCNVLVTCCAASRRACDVTPTCLSCALLCCSVACVVLCCKDLCCAVLCCIATACAVLWSAAVCCGMPLRANSTWRPYHCCRYGRI